MITPQQNRAVIRWLRVNARRPALAAEIWALCIENMDRSGRVTMPRLQMAQEVGCHHTEVSGALGSLAKAKALIRGREPWGQVVWTINPHVGTHLGKEARAKARANYEPVPMLPPAYKPRRPVTPAPVPQGQAAA